MVSGFKLALQSEIMLHPPEKIHSTATADPKSTRSKNEFPTYKEIPGIERISQASLESLGNLEL